MECGRLLDVASVLGQLTSIGEEAGWQRWRGGPGDGLRWDIGKGALAGQAWLSWDMVLEGWQAATWRVRLIESEQDGRAFELKFSLLPHCQARVRIPLSAVDQNRWMLDREGAWLKPLCGGARVRLEHVDRIELAVVVTAQGPQATEPRTDAGFSRVTWRMTAPAASVTEPALLESSAPLGGALIDELGQCRAGTWPNKTASVEAAVEALQGRSAAAASSEWPSCFSAWGGWRELRFEATGRFRVHHDDGAGRWWLVDPDGHAFWSTGLDVVAPRCEGNLAGLESAVSWLPERDGPFAEAFTARSGRPMFSYLSANLIRAFGAEAWRDRWRALAAGEMRALGFNTVGNWSDAEVGRQHRIPYVIPLHFATARVARVFREFPDVFDPAFESEPRTFAEQVRPMAGEVGMLGYFLTNEPTWGFAAQTPAEGMLLNGVDCHTRRALAEYLKETHGDAARLAAHWGRDRLAFEHVARGPWDGVLNEGARADLAAFSSIMAKRLFGSLAKACREAAPQLMNLGIRFHTVPPDWLLDGLDGFDVFSLNCYRREVPAEAFERVSQRLRVPILVGEWHFGALDAGLPASGIAHVADQAARGRAYRRYLEHAASQPWCVGVHWFTMYDQAWMGRFDGENYNIGFFDVCHRRYEPLAEAARASHAAMYDVAAGRRPPFADVPEYLAPLFY